jgi:hypothetical protein
VCAALKTATHIARVSTSCALRYFSQVLQPPSEARQRTVREMVPQPTRNRVGRATSQSGTGSMPDATRELGRRSGTLLALQTRRKFGDELAFPYPYAGLLWGP